MAVTELTEEQVAKFGLLAEFYGEEELHEDLVPYVQDCGDLGDCLRHPLVYSMMHHPSLNKMANRTYRAKLAAIAECRQRRNYRGIVWLHERPYRLAIFLSHAKAGRFSDHHYWDMLGQLWVDAENMHQTGATWREALLADRPRRWAMMDKRERDGLKALRRDGPVPVYRGFSYPDGQLGMSWTLDPQRAYWFAHRLLGLNPEVQRPRIAYGLVDPGDLIACFDGRGENEIALLPETVKGLKIRRATASWLGR